MITSGEWSRWKPAGPSRFAFGFGEYGIKLVTVVSVLLPLALFLMVIIHNYNQSKPGRSARSGEMLGVGGC
jgi:hypothetical protein